jgi:hypothetical protein
MASRAQRQDDLACVEAENLKLCRTSLLPVVAVLGQAPAGGD